MNIEQTNKKSKKKYAQLDIFLLAIVLISLNLNYLVHGVIQEAFCQQGISKCVACCLLMGAERRRVCARLGGAEGHSLFQDVCKEHHQTLEQ